MKTATVRSIREFLGLQVEDLTNLWGVTAKTVHRWEDATFEADSLIPDRLAAELLKLLDWFNEATDEVVDAVMTQDELYGPPETVNLSRYTSDAQARYAGLEMPANMHAALQGNIYAQLRAAGYAATIDWVPTEN